jgi:class 3 adenylate cyclase
LRISGENLLGKSSNLNGEDMRSAAENAQKVLNTMLQTASNRLSETQSDNHELWKLDEYDSASLLASKTPPLFPSCAPVPSRIPSCASACASEDLLSSTASTRSGRTSRSGSIKVAAHYADEVTVVLVDIQGFTAACAAMSAAAVGAWVADFYAAVDAAAAAHAVAKAEARGDSCVCVAGAAAAVPSLAPASAAGRDRADDQATRALAFAAALHDALRARPPAAGVATAVRIGVATGPAAFLVADAAAGPAAAPFASVLGEAAALAARMEAAARPGAVFVHPSTAAKWAAETGRPPPALVAAVGGAGPGHPPLPAAVFDCAARAFRGPAEPAEPDDRRRPAAEADPAAGDVAGDEWRRRLRRVASAP